MKSREAIRNTILSYTNEIWGTKNIERLDILIKVMIETLTNELYLLQDKLEHIDQSLLERIAHKLTPEKYVSIRPAHTLLHAKPDVPRMTLKQEHCFNLEKIPEDFINQGAKTIIFHPSCDVDLLDIHISSLFLYRKLYNIDTLHVMTEICELSTTPMIGNSIWLGLDVGHRLENLRNLSLYFKFPHVSEVDEVYDLLPYTKCYIGDKEIKLSRGFPKHSLSKLESDQSIVEQIDDYFLHVADDVDIKDMKQELLPFELVDYFSEEQQESLTKKLWMKLEFFPYINHEKLKDMQLLFNVFPVANRRLLKTSVSKNSFTSGYVLNSTVGEKLLAINTVVDANSQAYQGVERAEQRGTYHIDKINQAQIGSLSVVEYIESLLDKIDMERVAFKGLDRGVVEDALFSIKGETAFDEYKSKRNVRRIASSLSKIYISSYDDVRTANVDYWVSYGEYVNQLQENLTFQPDKISNLERVIATNITPVDGAKEYSRLQDLMAIDRYVISSRGRIVTAFDVQNFCKAELGDAVQEITVSLEGKESSIPRQGLIRVIRVELSSPNQDLHRTGMLRSLKTKMKNLSPGDYVYDIVIK